MISHLSRDWVGDQTYKRSKQGESGRGEDYRNPFDGYTSLESEGERLDLSFENLKAYLFSQVVGSVYAPFAGDW